MASATAPGLASEDWQIADETGPKPSSLVVQCRRRAYVLPYFRFLYAEGDQSQVKIAFASHLVTITGDGLADLLAALATSRLLRVVQPTENDTKFGVRGSDSHSYFGPVITEITVTKAEQ